MTKIEIIQNRMEEPESKANIRKPKGKFPKSKLNLIIQETTNSQIFSQSKRENMERSS